LREYIRYLVILWMVYVVLEQELDIHQEHQILKTTYRPKLLARSTALEADIEYLAGKYASSTINSTTTATTATKRKEKPPVHLPFPPAGLERTPFPVPSFLQPLILTPPKEVTDYQTRLKALSATSPESLLAHTYVRYLGDLSGGQLIGSRMRKTYNLREGKKGTEFYEFEEVDDDIVGNVEENRFEKKQHVNEIKDWFRTGVDVAIGDDQVLKCECGCVDRCPSVVTPPYLTSLYIPPLPPISTLQHD
jgi:heme oxygenase (biliverdin-producing, ferredoxin)